MAIKTDRDGQFDPDAELTHQFLVGCAVLVVLFIVISGVIGTIWLMR